MSTRDDLVARARELGCFEQPEKHTDKQLLDAIEAEQAAAVWMNRFEALPTDEAKRDAIHRLAADFKRGSNP